MQTKKKHFQIGITEMTIQASLQPLYYNSKCWRLTPLVTGRKLNTHKTLRRRPGRLLNVLCTFNLRHVSSGNHNALLELFSFNVRFSSVALIKLPETVNKTQK